VLVCVLVCVSVCVCVCAGDPGVVTGDPEVVTDTTGDPWLTMNHLDPRWSVCSRPWAGCSVIGH